jgi:hypothetical protein
MHTYHYHNTKHLCITLGTAKMPAFRILVLWDVSLVGRLEDFKPANQQNNNAVETSHFAVNTLLI